MLNLLDQLQNGPRGWPVQFLLLEIKYYLAAKDPTTFWSQLNFWTITRSLHPSHRPIFWSCVVKPLFANRDRSRINWSRCTAWSSATSRPTWSTSTARRLGTTSGGWPTSTPRPSPYTRSVFFFESTKWWSTGKLRLWHCCEKKSALRFATRH